MINARAETILEKASFKNLIRRKRAIIPADGFYEWKQLGSKKQPMRITMKDGAIFSMAALYDTWLAPDGRKISTCTIITTTPNSLMADIHDRMPVILSPEDEALWLNRDNDDVERLTALLRPYSAELMRAYPVSPIVGNVKNDTPECIEEQILLF
jgi:putative SOS response-associated peptidase YedK